MKSVRKIGGNLRSVGEIKENEWNLVKIKKNWRELEKFMWNKKKSREMTRPQGKLYEKSEEI